MSGFSSPLTAAELAALAVNIAEQIASTGISLLGAPQLLYDNSAVTPVGTPGLVGATISNHWMTPVPTEAQAITNVNTYTGIPLGNQVQRVYYGQDADGNGVYPVLTDQPLAACAAAGAKVQLCIKPSLAGITNPTVAAAEKSNITAMCNLLQGAGIKFDAVCFTEPNRGGHFTSAAQHKAYISTYGPTIRAGGTGGPVKLIYNPASYDMAAAQSYYPGDTWFDAVSFDWYGTDSKNQINPFTDLTWTNLPVGLSEWNAVAAAGDTINTQQWLTYTGDIISYFSARLANGETNWDIIMYLGYNASPLNQINSNTDWKIPQVAAIYEALAGAAPVTPGLTINGGATKTVPPISPTPGGGFAVANGISYDVTLNLTSAASSGNTDPFVIVQFNWYNIDALGSPPIEIAHWHVPIGAGATTGTITTGTGPQFGKYLQIKIVNNDTVTCTATLQVNSTSRTAPRDNWYWDALNSVDVPGYTQSNDGASFSNSLVSVTGVPVPAGEQIDYLMSLFSGWVTVSVSTPNGVPLQFQLIPQPTAKLGGGAVYDQTTASDCRNIFLPRAPCQLVVINPGGTAAEAFVEVIPYN